jgi:hypothetical protein
MVLLCILSDTNSKKYSKYKRNMHKKLRHKDDPVQNPVQQQTTTPPIGENVPQLPPATPQAPATPVQQNSPQASAPVQIQPINQSSTTSSVAQDNSQLQRPQFVNGLSLPGTCDVDANSLTAMFHDPNLKDNPNKDDMLTTQALTMILCAFNYQKSQIDQCLQKISLNSKKTVLSIIMRRADTNGVSEADIRLLNTSLAGCMGLETLSGQLMSRWLTIMPLISKFNGQPSLVAFFRRLKRFRRRMLKLRKIR